jgi:two-component system, OmpR family, response regulator CpxR
MENAPNRPYGETALLIDDDVALCEMLREYLGKHGWNVRTAHSGLSGIQEAQQAPVDLIVLDVMLPDLDGYEVLRKLQPTVRAGVLMLTARGEEIDRIVGLEMGADDYLAKPFNPRELLARMRAVARRYARNETPGRAGERFTVAGFQVDPASRGITFHSTAMDLTDLEFTLLQLFLRRPFQVIGREEICEQVFERPFRPTDRSPDMLVSRLRRKLEALEGFHGSVKAVRSSGYLFTPEGQKED